MMRSDRLAPALPTPRRRGRILAGMLAAFVLALAALVERAGAEGDAGTGPGGAEAPSSVWAGRWSEETLHEAALIPLQAEGRVKPLHTWAGFRLLSANHRRSCKDADGNKLTPVEWFLDVVFRPEAARQHRCFLVDTSEVLDAVGLGDLAHKKRDRYSYADLVPDDAARQRIRTAALAHHGTEAKERTRVEAGVIDLEQNLRVFEGLSHLVDFARVPAQDSESAQVQAALRATRLSILLRLVPPDADAEEAPEWLTVADVLSQQLTSAPPAAEQVQAVESLRTMTAAVGDTGAFRTALSSYRESVATLAERRGEYEKVPQEVAYYELDPFGRSLVLYLIAFALLACTWLPMPLRWLEIAAWVLLWCTLGLHVYGIIQRCLIRERPPITGLYDTVIFISAAAVLSTLVIEHMGRRGVALALAPILGALGLFIAGRYEILHGTDTMPQLVAVLDTNFWLATHVTCISIGYCAGLVASLIAHVYVLGKVFRFKQGDAAFYRDVGKMVYGTLCFALLFSLVGTILGGIWANDSWGRFWGWDPKENGALLICIAQLAILHGRMGGIFGTFGVCQGAILGGVIVAFSWWGVNLLGIGLHSYGFTTGIMRGLLIFYGVEGLVLCAGLFAWLRDRRARAARVG